MSDTAFPPELQALHELLVDCIDDDIDFEPYEAFLSPAAADEWLGAWTGNDATSASDYLVFGQDGTGGMAALWIIDATRSLLELPIVFFGSEGSAGVVANSFNDYLWLLAAGIGPCEAVEFGTREGKENKALLDFAVAHAGDQRRSPDEVAECVQDRNREFVQRVERLIR